MSQRTYSKTTMVLVEGDEVERRASHFGDSVSLVARRVKTPEIKNPGW